jgi:hypothetical protein
MTSVEKRFSRGVILDPNALVGRRVSVAYNIPRCAQRRPDAETACYSIRASTPYRGDATRYRPGQRVLGYVRVLLLRDVQWWVSQKGIEAIRRPNTRSGHAQRSVCCYALGEVARTSDATRPSFTSDGWEPIGFNPLRHRCFVVGRFVTDGVSFDDGLCVRESGWATFSINPTWATPMRVIAFANTRGPAHGPG